MNHVPAIRFAGFTDPWEQRKLGELCSFAKGRGYSKADICDSGVPLILYGRLYTRYQTRIDDVDTFAVEREGSLFSCGNEVIVPASGETAEDIAVASSVRRSDIVLGGDLNVLTPGAELDPDYVALVITYGKAHVELAKRAQGKSVVHIHNDDIADVDFPYPTTREQQAISSLALSFDYLITLHQRKYDKFVVLKKALLEKMFPRDGASVPEIRFAGFTDPWKQRKLGEVADIVFRTVEIEDDKEYQLVTVKRKNAGVVQRSVVKGRDILVKNYQELQTGDFLISKRQVVHGGNGLVPPSLSGAIVSNEYLVLVGNAKISSEFWALLSMTKTMCTCYFLSSFGVDIEKLVFDVDDWKKRQIAIPTQTEQSQICSFFRDLDDLITLHQRKLTLLRNLKAACLEKMFV